jgi:hypothetical protein
VRKGSTANLTPRRTQPAGEIFDRRIESNRIVRMLGNPTGDGDPRANGLDGEWRLAPGSI